jgi:hypothetical protein
LALLVQGPLLQPAVHNSIAAVESTQAAVLVKERDHISGLSSVAGGWLQHARCQLRRRAPT